MQPLTKSNNEINRSVNNKDEREFSCTDFDFRGEYSMQSYSPENSQYNRKNDSIDYIQEELIMKSTNKR